MSVNGMLQLQCDYIGLLCISIIQLTLNYITTDITVIMYYDCITIFTTIIYYYITKLFSLCYYYICNCYLIVFNIVYSDFTTILLITLLWNTAVMCCDYITAVLLHNLLSFKYNYNKESL